MPNDDGRPYLEQSIQDIKETLSEFRKDFVEHRVQLADRLGRIETAQDNTKEQVTKMNGSVARATERIFEIESEREKDRAAIVAVTLATSQQDGEIKKHTDSIGKLNSRFTFFRGKTAGLVAAASGASFIIFEAVKLFIEWHFHLISVSH
jgi:chromosome segregation ATPase